MTGTSELLGVARAACLSVARAACLLIALAAVSGGCSPAPTEPPTAGPSESPGPTASPSAATVVQAYFYLNGAQGSAGLVPVAREIPEQPTVGTAAVEAVLTGPLPGEVAAGISSGVPAGSRLLGLSIADGVAAVDLSREFESGGGSASVFVRLGQVVYTLTQFPTVQSVQFLVEGQPVSVFSGEGILLDGPVGRSDHDDLLPAILVDRPGYGGNPGNPARITGSANVFEAAFLVSIFDGNGARIAEVPAMATCGTGCRGTFDVLLPYSVAAAGWGTLRVWAASARDGSPENVRDYPIWLVPPE